MANTRTLNRSFAGGIIAPDMFGRIDDAKYQSGAAQLKNFIATPQGPAENRPGFAYVSSTKNNGKARLIPFVYSNDQTMVVELGDKYARFHTQGETLVYDSSAFHPWVAPSGAISYTPTTPAVITWNAHGLSSGDPVRFYVHSSSPTTALPGGMKTGYTYTVDKIDANSFRILDNGVPVGLSTTPATTYANYPGTGTTGTSAYAPPDDSSSNTSSAISGGIASTPVTGGLANLNADLTNVVSGYYAQGTAIFQYSIGGGSWFDFAYMTDSGEQSVSVPIAISDLNQLQLRVMVEISSSVRDSASIEASIGAWSVDVPTSSPGVAATLAVYRHYTAGDWVAYGGRNYTALKVDAGGMTTPGTDGTIWAQLPVDLTYEIPTPYEADDLFDIHYVQSADVITLVHPKYPPAELRRLGATNWKLTNIAFGQLLDAPEDVAVTSSPGYTAVITGVTNANPAVITTRASHSLSLGDGVYIKGLNQGGKSIEGFYLVNNVPLDGSGAYIPNQLTVMDYNGNVLGTGVTLGSSPTIQYGSKIFDITNYYVVTAMSEDGVNESPVSKEVSTLNNLNVTGSYNTVKWSAVENAARYRIYKKKNGLFGFVGETNNLSFNDNNIAPDFALTPPILDTVFNGTGEYPGAVSYFDQRRCFAGSVNKPQNAWMSKVGTEADFSYSLPVRDSDRIAFRVATREANTIRHIIPLSHLLLLTSSAELRVSPVNSDAVTPSDISVKPQSYVGASNVQPTVVNNALVYCAARGGHVRELGYNWQANGFITGDLSLRCSHLFDNLTIVDQTYAKAPKPVVWFVSSDGRLLGLTYIPEEQIGAWHEHSTQGYFESVCAVPEGNEDRLYAVIRRTINGSEVRYIERMASRIVGDLKDCFFVDAGATYSGVATKTISGLAWLEGETVSILADGAVCSPQTVTSGQIKLAHAAAKVQVGLPYDSDLQTLPLTLQIDGFGQGRTKNINKVWIRAYKSSGVFAGPDLDHLTEYKQRTTEPYGTPPGLQSEELEITVTPSWQDSGQLYIRQSNPLPLTVVSVTMLVSVGG